MGLAHGHSVSDNGDLHIQSGHGNLKGGAALGGDRLILHAIHNHIVVLAAAEDNGSHALTIGHGQLRGIDQSSLARAAFQGSIDGIAAVRQIRDRGYLGFRVGNRNLVVIPDALFADQGQVELLIQIGYGDIKAIDRLGQAVGIGHFILRGLQQLRSLLLGIFRNTREQIDNRSGCQTHMDGHFPILNGKRSLAIAGLVGMEHGAVGIEFGGVYAVLQRADSFGGFRIGGLLRSLGLGFRHSLGGPRGGGGLGGSGLATGGQGHQQQSCQQKRGNLFHFLISFIWNSPRGIRPRVIPGL